MKEQIKKLMEHKKIKGKETMIVFILVGVILAIMFIPINEKKETVPVPETDTEEIYDNREVYEERLERRLEEILSRMEGVGKVEVMITLQSSAKEVVEKDYTMQQSKDEDGTEGTIRSNVSKEENTVYADTDMGNVPYVVQEIYPQVEGVLVVAEGGGDSYINLSIVEAIQALFDVDIHKIKIVKMNTD